MIWLWLIPVTAVLLFSFVIFRGAPYVPSHKVYIRKALRELYKLDKDDVLVDIGSGDGVVLREASKMGARAVGYEINPILVLVSRFLSRKYNRISIHLTDFWLAHVPDDTTVVYVFSVTRDAKKIIEWMQNETNRLNRPLYLINYGSELTSLKAMKNVGAYRLYIFRSLQSKEAQV
jgi:hypothetical protein